MGFALGVLKKGLSGGLLSGALFQVRFAWGRSRLVGCLVAGGCYARMRGVLKQGPLSGLLSGALLQVLLPAYPLLRLDGGCCPEQPRPGRLGGGSNACPPIRLC